LAHDSDCASATIFIATQESPGAASIGHCTLFGILHWLYADFTICDAHLEDAVPQTPLTPEVLSQVGGILILGNAVEGGLITRDRGEVMIRASAERVTKAFQLLRQHPELPFIASGYSGRLLPQEPSEADAFKQLLQEQGLGSHPGYYENQSRNTYENMLFSKKIIDGLAEKEIFSLSLGS
jgi:uncharacterized SAM-binding protein YcdF (DUF218 family)